MQGLQDSGDVFFQRGCWSGAHIGAAAAFWCPGNNTPPKGILRLVITPHLLYSSRVVLLIWICLVPCSLLFPCLFPARTHTIQFRPIFLSWTILLIASCIHLGRACQRVMRQLPPKASSAASHMADRPHYLQFTIYLFELKIIFGPWSWQSAAWIYRKGF